MLTHYNVVKQRKAIGDCMDLSTADRMMIQVPMFHRFGMVLAMTASMTHGVTCRRYPRSQSPRLGLEFIDKEKITAFPRRADDVYRHALARKLPVKTDFSHIAYRHHGRQPLPHKSHERRRGKNCNMSEICITYCQTEASPATTMSKNHRFHRRCASTRSAAPIFGVECKIVDGPRRVEELPVNKDGRILRARIQHKKGNYKMPRGDSPPSSTRTEASQRRPCAERRERQI
jgi:fatty-acyl-CoA synthase